MTNFEANSNVYCTGMGIDLKNCEIKTDGKGGISIKDSTLAQCRITHNIGSVDFHGATVKGFVLVDNVYNEKMSLINKCEDTYVSMRSCDLSKSGGIRIEYFGEDSFFRNIERCEFRGKNNYLKLGDEGSVEINDCLIQDTFTALECCVVRNSEIGGACDLIKTTIDDSTIIESSISSVTQISSSLISDCDIKNVTRIDSSFLEKEELKDIEVIENREGKLREKSVYKNKMDINQDKSVKIEL